MIERLPDWLPRLANYFDQCWRLPFEYGRHDCALFAAGGVAAMTGFDPALEFRGRYSSLKDGLKLVRRLGFQTNADMVSAHFVEIKPCEAATGDIGAYPVDDSGLWALGIVNVSRLMLLRPGEQGIGHCDFLEAKRAFRI